MSLASAIERVKKNGHAEFPIEIEEGIHLLLELGVWLVSQYPGRIVSWRLQCTRLDSEKPSQRNNREIILGAEALIQIYHDLSLVTPEILFPEIDGRLVMTAPKLPLPADPGNMLLEGWRIGVDPLVLRERGGLLRLKIRLATNREVWSAPDIRLDTNLSLYREDGVLINIADVSDSRVWAGGLTRGIARVVAKNVSPNIDLRLGATRWQK